MKALRRRFAPTAFALATSACAGVNAPSDATGANPITIEVIGINGARSFSPNPKSIPAVHPAVWHNGDIETHHIVLDDGSVDTGPLRPRVERTDANRSGRSVSLHDPSQHGRHDHSVEVPEEARVATKDEENGVDRRGFLRCMAWVGTGAVWTMSSGS